MKRIAGMIVGACIWVTCPAQAQQVVATSSAPRLLNATERTAIVTGFAEAMRDRYVFPDLGSRTAATLEAHRRAGDYDTLTSTAALAARLSVDAEAIVHDKHLRVMAHGVTPSGGPHPASTRPAPPRAEAGIVRADRLADGIGYIEVIGFPPLAYFRRAADAAMTSLKGSRAIIIDVRRNGGGEPASAAYLVSFFVRPGRPINTILTRTAKTTTFTREDFASTATPIRFETQPVIVLTGKSTFSGGEELAYDVQALRRAKLIGEVTGGGANPVEPVDLGQGVMATIPTGRAENPITHTNWEGRGVQPDIAVPASEALGRALQGLGQPTATDIAAVSRQQVFGGHTQPWPGSGAALRALVGDIAAGRLDESRLMPGFVTMVRPQLAELTTQIAPLGALKDVRFLGPDELGGDEYRLQFERGVRTMALVLSPDGRIDIASPPEPERR